jgi:regulator of replication initiation timing
VELQLRNYQVRDLGDRLKVYDAQMSAMQTRADKLATDNEALEAHCSSIQAHLDMLDTNRRIAQEQIMDVQRRHAEEAKARVQKQLPALKQIVRWYRSLKNKWEAERKASKGKKKKGK